MKFNCLPAQTFAGIALLPWLLLSINNKSSPDPGWSLCFTFSPAFNTIIDSSFLEHAIAVAIACGMVAAVDTNIVQK